MDKGIDGGSVAGVLQVQTGLELVKKSFYDELFPQQYFIQHGHQVVFHIAANTGDQVKAPLPEALQQRLRKIAFISKDLPL